MQPEVIEFINRIIRLYKKYKMQFNALGIGMIILVTIQGLVNALVIDAILFTYISYKTLLAIKTDHKNNAKLVTVLKLWGSYSTYIIAEKIMDIFMYFTPFSFAYYTSKVGFYLWILKSDENVITYYDSVVTPLFNQYESHITIFMEGLERCIKISLTIMLEYTTKAKGILVKFITEKINEETFLQIENKLNSLQFENLGEEINKIELDCDKDSKENSKENSNENSNENDDNNSKENSNENNDNNSKENSNDNNSNENSNDNSNENSDENDNDKKLE